MDLALLSWSAAFARTIRTLDSSNRPPVLIHRSVRIHYSPLARRTRRGSSPYKPFEGQVAPEGAVCGNHTCPHGDGV